jgi:hypothetical protein
MVTTILVLGGWFLLSVLLTAAWAAGHVLVRRRRPTGTAGAPPAGPTAYGDRPVRAPHRVAY